MVAQLAAEPSYPPLLMEPQRPEEGRRAQIGWRRVLQGRRTAFERWEYIRRHEHDEYGALVQRTILAYYLGGVRRPVVADWLGMTEDSAQKALRGEIWAPYVLPVRAALTRLGIPLNRGNRREGGQRLEEIIRAQAAVMRRALETPDDPQVRDDMRILTACWQEGSTN